MRSEIPAEWLPQTYEGPEMTGRITAAAAHETGLREGTPVMAGGGDQAAGAVGAGAVRPGIVALTLGTSGVVFATTERPLVEPQGRLHAFCHALKDRWHFMGVTLSAAGSLQWYRDTLAPSESFDALVQEAESAPPGCEGLTFLPYLSGERTPYPDPLARASFVGLTVRHRRAHMTRAVLEGVAFSMRDCFDLLKAAGLPEVDQVRVAGGGARSALWRRIIASVLNVEIVTVNSTEGAAFGAALLGRRRRLGLAGRSHCVRGRHRDHRTRPARSAVEHRVPDRLLPLSRVSIPHSSPPSTASAAPLPNDGLGAAVSPAARGVGDRRRPSSEPALDRRHRRPRARKPPAYVETCTFCPGNPRVSGRKNDPYTGVFVFDNDAPCVGDEAKRARPLSSTFSATGPPEARRGSSATARATTPPSPSCRSPRS